MIKNLCFQVLVLSLFLTNLVQAQRSQLIVPVGHRDDIVDIAFSEKGDFLLTGSIDRTLKVWRVKDGALMSTINPSCGWVMAIDIIPGANKAIIGCSNGIGIFDFKTFAFSVKKENVQFSNSTISADGSEYFYITMQGKLQKTNNNLENEQTIFTNPAHDFNRTTLAYIPGQKKLFISESGLQSSIIDLTSNTVTQSWNLEKSNFEYWLGEGKLLHVIDARSSRFSVLDMSTKNKIAEQEIPAFCISDRNLVIVRQNKAYINIKDNYYELNSQTAQFKKISLPISGYHKVAYTSKSDMIAVGSGPALGLYNSFTHNLIRSFGMTVYAANNIKASHDFKKIYLSLNRKSNKIVQIDNGSLTIKGNKFINNNTYQLLAGDSNVLIEYPDYSDGGYIDHDRYAFGNTGKKIVFDKGSNGLEIVNIPEKTVACNVTGNFEFAEILFSKNDNTLYVCGRVCNLNGSNEANVLALDISSGTPKLLWEKKDIKGFGMRIDYEKQKITLLQLLDKLYLVTIQLQTGSIISKTPILQNEDIYSTISRIHKSDFFYDGNHIILVNKDGNYEIHDISDKDLSQPMAYLYLFADTDDWLVATPDGRFDGSESAMKKLYYSKKGKTIPIISTYEYFYIPKLLGRLLAGEKLPPVPDNLKDIKLPPTVSMNVLSAGTRNLNVEEDNNVVKVTEKEIEVAVKAEATEGNVEEVRLFQNGKIINLASRNLIVSDEKDNIVTKKYLVPLQPGINTIRSLALNDQRTESDPQEILVSYTGAGDSNIPEIKPSNIVDNTPIDQVDPKATLHLIVVGINKYENSKMNLNYAIADATAFKEEIEKDAKSLLSNVKTYFVADASASTEGIKNAFKQVQSTAKPGDVFVFYYAGHGVVSTKNKEFYLVPTNVSNLSNVDAELADKGIASKTLQQYAIDISAQKQVFILDACQSAGAFEQMLQQSGDQQKSLALVARSTGTHWLAASGSQQFANEFSQLGHGAFTYILLNALKGEAMANKMITVYGLRNFLATKVPELLKKYGGVPQYPASYGFGNDFPVELIK